MSSNQCTLVSLALAALAKASWATMARGNIALRIGWSPAEADVWQTTAAVQWFDRSGRYVVLAIRCSQGDDLAMLFGANP
jgi:hypothetical protein